MKAATAEHLAYFEIGQIWHLYCGSEITARFPSYSHNIFPDSYTTTLRAQHFTNKQAE
jgi:hypothetical protein